MAASVAGSPVSAAVNSMVARFIYADSLLAFCHSRSFTCKSVNVLILVYRILDL